MAPKTSLLILLVACSVACAHARLGEEAAARAGGGGGGPPRKLIARSNVAAAAAAPAPKCEQWCHSHADPWTGKWGKCSWDSGYCSACPACKPEQLEKQVALLQHQLGTLVAEQAELEAGYKALEAANRKQVAEKEALEAGNKALEAANHKQAACLNGECVGKDTPKVGFCHNDAHYEEAEGADSARELVGSYLHSHCSCDCKKLEDKWAARGNQWRIKDDIQGFIAHECNCGGPLGSGSTLDWFVAEWNSWEPNN